MNTTRNILKKSDDPVHPEHYNQFKIEPIDAIEEWDLNFNLGNVIKYVARAKHKGSELDDLQKARFYLNREIKRKELENNDGNRFYSQYDK